MRAGGQGYLWPWALVFMWSRILMACLSRPSTLRKYTLLSTKLFTALKQKGVTVSQSLSWQRQQPRSPEEGAAE